VLKTLPNFPSVGLNLPCISANDWYADAIASMLDSWKHTPLFPCYFALNATAHGTLLFSSLPPMGGDSELIADLRDFLTFYRGLPYRAALLLYLEGETTTLAEDERRFWGVLRAISAASQSKVRVDYDSIDWKFVFDDEFLFFNGHSPHYSSRRSRRAPKPLIVIQTLFNLRQISDNKSTVPAVAEHIRGLVDKYDPIKRSPYLNGKESDWRQFWLLDHNNQDNRVCPLIQDQEISHD
jgi:FPC/CPF motif-containing protein YcgG